jgi:hypothetical protein
VELKTTTMMARVLPRQVATMSPDIEEMKLIFTFHLRHFFYPMHLNLAHIDAFPLLFFFKFQP